MTYRAFILSGLVLIGIPGPSAVALAQGQPARPSRQQPSPAPAPQSSPAAQPASSANVGTILGMVTDSLHGHPLADASVTVVQLPKKSAMTSNTGAFRIDSIPPGTYTLEILHPVLDSLGIRVVSDSVKVVGGDVQATTMAIPSGPTLVAQICPTLQKQLGPGAVMGQVLDAETGAPMVGAEVSVAWFETEVSPTLGVRTSPRVRKAVIAESGTFRICGVPQELHGTLQASLNGAVTGEVELLNTNELLLVRFLRLSRESAKAAVRDTSLPGALLKGRGVVSGRVTNQGGVPIGGARVVVNGSVARGISGNDGTFTLTDAPLGTQMIEVRQLGYLPKQVVVDVTPKADGTVVVRLDATNSDAVQLSSVDVKEKAVKSALEREGFNRRRGRENGRFLTLEDIEKLQPVTTSDILRRVPGLYVQGSGQSVTVVSSRGNSCVRFKIDQHYSAPSQGLSIDEFVNPTDIAAVEFYQAGNVPMALQNARVGGCALVVVWTKAQVRPSTIKTTSK